MILVFFVAALSGASVAQTPVFRGGVETVEVTVTVTDGQGRLITGLTKDDFTIYEEEQLQEDQSAEAAAEETLADGDADSAVEVAEESADSGADKAELDDDIEDV